MRKNDLEEDCTYFFVRRATAEVASKIVPKGRKKKSFNCRFQVFYVVIILLKPA